jgi:hypothetical protein
MKIKRLKTAGYRGPGTNMQYLAPGWYGVGDRLDIVNHQVPDELARYLLDTGQVLEFEAAEDDLPPVPATSALGATPPEPQIGDHEMFTDGDGEVWDLTLLREQPMKELRELAASEGIELSGHPSKEDIINQIVGKQD